MKLERKTPLFQASAQDVQSCQIRVLQSNFENQAAPYARSLTQVKVEAMMAEEECEDGGPQPME